MTAISFSCPLCGHAFDPAAHAACATCPLNRGCRTVCCPNCGHTTVDPRDSRLARWAAAALARLGVTTTAPPAAVAAGARPLTSMPTPSRVRVVAVAGASAGVERLGAYGLTAGATLEIIQQRPVPLVRIEQTELAIEAEVAQHLLVEPAEG